MNLNFFTKIFLVLFALSTHFSVFTEDISIPAADLAASMAPAVNPEAIKAFLLEGIKESINIKTPPAIWPTAVSGVAIKAIAPTAVPQGMPQAATTTLSSSNLTPQQMALIAAAAAVTTGGTWYLYHRNYIKPTDKTIDDSLDFVHNLINDPFFFMKPINGDTTMMQSFFSGYKDFFENKKNEMLKALGLKKDILNVASYFQKGNFGLNPSQDSYLNKLFYIEYEKIDELFTELNKTAQISINDLNNPSHEELKSSIRKLAIDPYIYLLKAKSSLPNEIEKNNSFVTQENIKNKNFKLSDLDIVLLHIVNHDTHSKGYEISSFLASRNKKIDKLFNIFKKYITKPKDFKPKNNTAEQIYTAIQNLKNEKASVERELYGNWIYSKFEKLISNSTTINYKEKEKKEIENFYETLEKEILQGTGTSEENLIASARYLCLLMLRNLPEEQKISLIKDFTEKAIEPRPVPKVPDDIVKSAVFEEEKDW